MGIVLVALLAAALHYWVRARRLQEIYDAACRRVRALEHQVAARDASYRRLYEIAMRTTRLQLQTIRDLHVELDRSQENFEAMEGCFLRTLRRVDPEAADQLGEAFAKVYADLAIQQAKHFPGSRT